MRTTIVLASAIVFLVLVPGGSGCGGRIGGGDPGGDGGSSSGSMGTGSSGGGRSSGGSGTGPTSGGADAGASDSTSGVDPGDAGFVDGCIPFDASPFDAGADCYEGPGSGPGSECGCTAGIAGNLYNINCDGSDTPTCTCNVNGAVVSSFTMDRPLCQSACGYELPTLADQFVAPSGCGFPEP